MIKVEVQVQEDKGIIAFAFESNKEADYEHLDWLCQILAEVPDSKVGFIRSNRLVGQFKGFVSASDDTVYE